MIDVTILSAATVFQGGDTCYRYDLTADGLAAGDDVAGAVDQVRALTGPGWPDADVRISGPASAVDPLAAALDAAGATVIRGDAPARSPATNWDDDAHSAAATAVDSSSFASRTAAGTTTLPSVSSFAAPVAAPLDDEDMVTAKAVSRIEGRGDDAGLEQVRERDAWAAAAYHADEVTTLPHRGAGETQRRKRPAVVRPQPQKGWRRFVFPVTVGLVALIVFFLAMHGFTFGHSQTTVTTAPPPVETASTSMTASQPSKEPSDTAGTLTEAGIAVTAPIGWSAASRSDGTVMATGPDPDIRIIIAADPTAGLTPDTVLAEVASTVSGDRTLTPLRSAGFPRPPGHPEALSYEENPGDGSLVRWTTWVEGDVQLSVGCHTRRSPTMPQKAACRMAVTTAAVVDRDALPSSASGGHLVDITRSTITPGVGSLPPVG